jgi:hypothetical protein
MNMSTLCTSLHRACIIALTAMVASPTAQAADTTLMLACQGTKTNTLFETGAPIRKGQPNPISMGIIVNLTDRTVTGLEDHPPLTIRSVNETTIAFGWFRDVCRQSISDSWLGNLRECLAHLV